jgi:class 3 adenylate cyclase/tetratricopeptide (TPR) repeat protein
MKCLKCGAEQPEGSKFCGDCGGKMEIPCPKCSKANPSENSFCNECGHDLRKSGEAKPLDLNQPRSYTPKHLAEKILTTRSSIEGERKIVTVMFADVANSTAMFEKLDPEAVHEIMDKCFRLLLDEIHRYEGTINQFLGDGVMALFGSPIAHEDHAQRACHAALAVQKSMTQYAESLKDIYGIDLKMRIGLNSGPVVVGSVGDDLRMDYTAKGDTVNLAARMEASAEPGRVLVSEHLYKQSKEFFEFERISEVHVKGKQEPVEAYRLVRPAEVQTRIAASAARGFARFVGRTREIEALRETFEKAKAGEGQVVGIVGEAGVGKSRMLLEFKNCLPHDEYRYLEGRCLHYGGSMPYLPILDVLRSFVGVKEGEQEQVVRQKLKERVLGLDEGLRNIIAPLHELLSVKVNDEAYEKLDPKQKKEKTFEGIRDLLIRGSQDQPLVLAVEDLQWIDRITEEFLGYMIGWLPRTKILLLLLYRPEYTHQWGSKSYYNRVAVGELSSSRSAELVAAILESGDTAPELRELILGRAAGNPFFIEELTFSLLENGSIQKTGESFFLAKDASGVQVPDTIQGIIAARLDRLEESLKRIMQVAAVIGREFAFRILEMITAMQEGLKSGLVNLQGLEFIYEKSLFPELEYIFKHALTQEVAYNSLLVKRRKEIHEQTGQAIEKLYADRLEEFYGMLAYHYSKSDNSMRAYEYLKLSARKAVEREALWEAFRLYRDAADTLDRFPKTLENKRELVQLLVSMATPMRMLAYPEDSEKYLQQCEDAAKEINDPRTSVNVLSVMGLYHCVKGDPGVGKVSLENAFREAQKLEDIGLIAGTGYDLIISHFVRTDMASVVDTADKVLPVIAKANRQREMFGRPLVVYSLIKAMKGHALAWLGDFPGGESVIAEALSLATELNHIATIAHDELKYGWFFGLKGGAQACVDHNQRAVQLMERIKAVLWLGHAYVGIGQGHYLLGKYKEAIAYIEKGLGISNKLGYLIRTARYYLFLSMIYFETSDMSKASLNAEEALRLAQRCAEKENEALSKIMLGRLAARGGKFRVTEAEQFVLEGIRMLQDQGLKPDEAIGYLHLGELYLDVGHTAKAYQPLNKADVMFREMGMDYWPGKAQKALAKL